jgi:glycosyltransferase involved in cell wall biosynthesis
MDSRCDKVSDCPIRPRKEIIVVDDGSRDQTSAVARRFASKNVAVLKQEHQGPAMAENRAFSVCQGDYIQWLIVDDLLSPQDCENNWRLRRCWKQSGHYYRLNGALSPIAPIGPDFVARPCGTIFHRLSGCFERWGKDRFLAR